MPEDIKIIDGIVHTKFSGELNLNAILAHLNKLLEFESQVDDHYELMDLGEVDGINLSADDIIHFATIGRRIGNTYIRSVLAIYAPTDISFGMSRMFEIIAESIHSTQVKVFRKKDEAMEFLSKRKVG